MIKKVYKNTLMLEQMYKLTPQEKQKIIKELTKNKSQRELAKELGIPHSTIHDWASGRQSKRGDYVHISISSIYRKLKSMKPKDIEDWGRLEQIKEVIEDLLRKKK